MFTEATTDLYVHLCKLIMTLMYQIAFVYTRNAYRLWYSTAVFEILLAFSQNKDWKKSFYEVIPPRKLEGESSTVVQHEHVGDIDELGSQHTSSEQCTADDIQELNIQHASSEQYTPDGDQESEIRHSSPERYTAKNGQQQNSQPTLSEQYSADVD